jgi:hypothetical protein
MSQLNITNNTEPLVITSKDTDLEVNAQKVEYN